MERVGFDQRGDKNDHVTRYFRDRVTKEEKNITIQVPDGIVLSGEIGAGAAQTTITSLTTMETALLCLLDPDALLYECVRYGTISEKPELIDGHRCWRVDIPAEKFLGKGFHTLTFVVWLDPDIGFCPRRLDRRSVRSAGDHDVASIRLQGYREVAKGVWFPTEQVIETTSNKGKVVSTLRDIQVGKPIAPNDRAIEFPPGLPVRDRAAASAESSRRSMGDRDSAGGKGKEPSAPGWRERFDKVYRLEEGQALKRIAPPFIPERLDYYRHEDWRQATLISHAPDYYLFRWDDKLNLYGYGFGDKASLESILRFIGLVRFEYDGEMGLLRTPLPGDWIVHEGSPREARIAALEKILRQDPDTQIRFTRKQVERTVIVARGRFKFHPLEDPPHGRGSVHIFSDTLDRNDNGRGGQGKMNEFLRAVGDSLNCPVVNETQEDKGARIHWAGNDSGTIGDLPDGEEKDDFVQRVTANLAKQTSLQFVTQRHKVDVWFISEDDTSR